MASIFELSALPYDILTHIFDLCDRSSLLAACLVSRDIYEFASRDLYASLFFVLDRTPFCDPLETLKKRPLLATSVHALSFRYGFVSETTVRQLQRIGDYVRTLPSIRRIDWYDKGIGGPFHGRPVRCFLDMLRWMAPSLVELRLPPLENPNSISSDLSSLRSLTVTHCPREFERTRWYQSVVGNLESLTIATLFNRTECLHGARSLRVLKLQNIGSLSQVCSSLCDILSLERLIIMLRPGLFKDWNAMNLDSPTLKKLEYLQLELTNHFFHPDYDISSSTLMSLVQTFTRNAESLQIVHITRKTDSYLHCTEPVSSLYIGNHLHSLKILDLGAALLTSEAIHLICSEYLQLETFGFACRRVDLDTDALSLTESTPQPRKTRTSCDAHITREARIVHISDLGSLEQDPFAISRIYGNVFLDMGESKDIRPRAVGAETHHLFSSIGMTEWDVETLERKQCDQIRLYVHLESDHFDDSSNFLEMFTSTLTTLPYEVLDIIFSEMERPSLVAACLVSHHIYEFASRVLYGSVLFVVGKDAFGIKYIEFDTVTVSKKDAQRLQQTCYCVRTLPEVRNIEWFDSDVRGIAHSGAIADFLDMLTDIAESIERLRLPPLWAQNWKSQWMDLYYLKDLTITNCFPHFGLSEWYQSIIGQLESLTICTLIQRPEFLQGARRLRVLKLTSVWSLDKLYPDLSALNHLEELSITLRPNQIQEWSFRDDPATRLTRLRSLEIGIDIYSSTDLAQFDPASLVTLVRNLTAASDSLQVARMYSLHPGKQIDCLRSLLDIFVTKYRRSLRVLDLSVMCLSNAVLTWIYKQCPMLEEVGFIYLDRISSLSAFAAKLGQHPTLTTLRITTHDIYDLALANIMSQLLSNLKE
ncbi:hypothetical protein FRC17_004407, partial [Serendipita sp. 399]